MSGEKELRYLGCDELDDGFGLVEWPDRAPGLTAQADLALTLTYQREGRRAELTGRSERGDVLIAALNPF